MKPIDAETYVALRVLIDAGADATRAWVKARASGCGDPVIDPDIDYCFPEMPQGASVRQLASRLYEYVPWEAVSLAPAQALVAGLVDPPWPGGAGGPLDSLEGRLGWTTFADRDALVAALDSMTPAEVLAQVGDKLQGPPSAGAGQGWAGAWTDGLGWWAVALSAVGVLAWLGKRTVWGFVVSVGAERLLRWLAKAGAVTALGYAGLKILDAASQAASQAASRAASSALWVGLAVVGVGLTVGVGVAVARSRRRRELRPA